MPSTQQYPEIADQLAALGANAGTFFAPTNSALAAATERSKAAGKPLTNERLRDILVSGLRRAGGGGPRGWLASGPLATAAAGIELPPAPGSVDGQHFLYWF